MDIDRIDVHPELDGLDRSSYEHNLRSNDLNLENKYGHMSSDSKVSFYAFIATIGIIVAICIGLQLSSPEPSEPKAIDYEIEDLVPINVENAKYRIQFFADEPGECELYFKDNRIQFTDGTWSKHYDAGFNTLDLSVFGHFSVYNIDVRFNGISGVRS